METTIYFRVIVIMEKKMETTIYLRVIVIMEKKMETTIYFRVIGTENGNYYIF